MNRLMVAAILAGTFTGAMIASAEDGYIESDGSLGFNTSYYVGPNTKLELDFQLTSLVANTNSTGYTDLNERLMAIESPYDVSSYATNLPRFIVYLGFYDNKPKLSFKGSAADGSPQARNLYDADIGRHTMVIDIPASSDHFKVFTDGVQSFASGNTYGAFLQKTATIPLALFGETECSNPDRSGNTFPNRPQLGYSYQNRSKMKVFGFKCYEKENGEYVLKRNFVPCLKGGVPGFKDEVSGYFFTGENVDTVKYGGNIMVVKDDPYLSTGPYNSVAKAAAAGECIYIDTGYYPKTTSRIELDFAPLTPNSWTSSTKYAHDTEFLYAEHSSGTYYAFEIDGMNNHGYIGVKVGNADHRYVARLCDAYNIRRTISVNSNSVVMVVSVVANLINVAGNALSLYGWFGLPALGTAGAAIATVISRYVELIVLIVYTGTHSAKNPFIIGAFRSFRIPLVLCRQFILKMLPLMANETLWSLGITILNQCYSYRSLDAVAAVNIETTLWNLLTVAFVATGEAVGIVVGQKLGAGEVEKAKDYGLKMRDLTVFFGIICGIIMAVLSPVFPLFYNTTDEVRHLASILILLSGIVMPLMAFTHASYFIIRAGGNTFITLIFDSGYTWVIVVPLAFILSRFTSASVPVMMFAVQWAEIIKCSIGEYMVRSGMWARNIVR